LGAFTPEIRSFGIGESHFYWQFKSHIDRGVPQGTTHVLFVLKVPRGTGAISAEIWLETVVAKAKPFGSWKDVKAHAEAYRGTWRLSP
jgi:hypothetical protein